MIFPITPFFHRHVGRIYRDAGRKFLRPALLATVMCLFCAYPIAAQDNDAGAKEPSQDPATQVSQETGRIEPDIGVTADDATDTDIHAADTHEAEQHETEQAKTTQGDEAPAGMIEPALGPEDMARFTKNETPLGEQVEEIKKAALELNRDLLLLEEDLLFPASTQVAVYISMDVGKYFNLDTVKLKIDDELVASHLYTAKQNSALIRGGIQRLYLGNLKTGKHEVTAFFHGIGPQKREYKRGATYTLNKDQKPTMLEIRIMDSTRSLQPEFDFKEWHL